MVDMDAEFERAKRSIEAEQGKSLSPDEEVEVKGLFYFAKGVKLKDQLEQKQSHRARVLSACCDYFNKRKK